MKKPQAKKIREIAETLGTVMTHTHEWVPISGEDLLLSGMGKGPEAKSIDRNRQYEIQIPVIIHHSAKKALKRAMKSEGIQGVTKIVKKEHDKLFFRNSNAG